MQQPSTSSGVTSGKVRSSTRPLPSPSCICRYLSGVLDFTEELSRHAIQRATVRDTPAVQRCRDIVDAIMGQFMQVGVGWRCGAECGVEVWGRCGAAAITGPGRSCRRGAKSIKCCLLTSVGLPCAPPMIALLCAPPNYHMMNLPTCSTWPRPHTICHILYMCPPSLCFHAAPACL